MQFNTKINIKKIKYKIIHGVLICGVAIAFSIISVYFYRDYDFGSMNSNYLKSSDIIKLYDISNSEYLILDRESFEHFEENCIGNKSSFLSQYGEIYKNDELKCFSKESNSILSINDKDKTISESSSSYFNVIDNIVYFRNDTDFKLYSYNIKTEEIKCLLTEKVGQVIVSTKGISYISLSNHSLNFISFDNYKTTRIGDENILKYYVVGNKYLCLTTDSKLILLDSKENKVIDSNVEEFVYNGNLVVQKGSNLYLYKTFKNIDKILIEGENHIQTLIEDNLYYVSYDNFEEELNRYNLNTGNIEKIETIKNNKTVKGYYFSPEESVLTTASLELDAE